MTQIANDDLVKISEFLNSLESMINGKFILADIKISKLLKMISNSNELYNYIKNCLVNFSFEKEISRCEISNRFNNGEFKMPTDESKIVALVFCLFVEFDAKRIDFYKFINENFGTTQNYTEYQNFSHTVLLPFKEIILNHFLNSSAIKEEQIVEEQIVEESQPVINNNSDSIFNRIDKILDNMLDNMKIERRIKSKEKEELEYIINSAKYSLRYEDMRIINGFISVLNMLSDRYACFRLPLKDLKGELLKFYSQAKM